MGHSAADNRGTKYRTIVADPPWPLKRTTGWGTNNNRSLSYPTMSPDEIAALDIESLADNPAHLYLWTVGRFLREAFTVAEAWGFRYSTPLVWCKPVTGRMLGGLYTPTVEFILFCRRGTEGTPGKPNRLAVDRSWFEWPRGKHSQKPDAFFDLVETVSPGPYLELFARRQRLGWDTWGNEALNHVNLTA